MKTFKQFLAEAGAHKREISVEEAVKLINTHCRDALANGPLYRGMSPEGEAFVLHGEASTRRSANTSNYYTVILDHFLPPLGYPKRGQSIILANNLETARMFGKVYAIFPYDGVGIGVCAASDLWYSPEFRVGISERQKIKSWNDIWKRYGLSADSYEDFVESVKEAMADSGRKGEELTNMFGSPDRVEPALKKAYSPETLGLSLASPADLGEYPSSNAREMWIGGRCVAIRREVWESMKDDVHDHELAPEDDE